jgi:hypothetical protein
MVDVGIEDGDENVFRGIKSLSQLREDGRNAVVAALMMLLALLMMMMAPP